MKSSARWAPPVFALALLASVLLSSSGLSLRAATAQDQNSKPAAADRARAINEAAIKAFKDNRWEDALTEFKKAMGIDPKNKTIRKNVARCYAHIATKAFNERRFEEAARDFKLAEDYDSSDASYPLSRARALIEGREYKDAIDVLEALIKAKPKLARAHSLLGLANYQAGRNAEAIKSWDQALALDPKDELAKSYRDKVKKEEAVEEKLVEDFGATHFLIKFDGRCNPDLGRVVGEALEDAYETVGREFGVYPSGQTAVVVYPGRTFRQITGAHSWVKALYDGKIRVPAKGLKRASAASIRRTFRHEYTHALVSHLAGKKCPVWFHEGLAQMLDGRQLDSSLKVIRKLGVPKAKLFQGRFIGISSAKTVQQLYAAAHAFTSWLADRAGGLSGLEPVLRLLGKGKTMDAALKSEIGDDFATLYKEWTNQ